MTKKFLMRTLLLIVGIFIVWACDNGSGTEDDDDTGESDSDGDSDTDADTDSDADTDTSTEGLLVCVLAITGMA